MHRQFYKSHIDLKKNQPRIIFFHIPYYDLFQTQDKKQYLGQVSCIKLLSQILWHLLAVLFSSGQFYNMSLCCKKSILPFMNYEIPRKKKNLLHSLYIFEQFPGILNPSFQYLLEFVIWDKFISSLIPFLRIKILLDEENSACLKMYSYRHAPCVPPGPKTVVAELRWGIKLEHFGEMCSLLFPPHAQHENYW